MPTTLYEYATGRIVLWTRKDSGIDVTRGLGCCATRRVRRIAIANPERRPVRPRGGGRAAQRQASTTPCSGKLVLGENISQTAQLADSGNADVGIIAHSLALGPALRASGIYAEIPASAHPPIEQAAIVVSASKNKEAARRFLAYLRRDRGAGDAAPVRLRPRRGASG